MILEYLVFDITPFGGEDRAPDEFDNLTKNCNSDCVNDKKVISSLF